MGDTTSGDFPLDSKAFGVESKEEAAPQAPEVTKPEVTSEESEETSETVEPAKEEQSDEDKELRRKAQDAHNLVIEMIGEKFREHEAGRLSDEQLQEWFSEHPTIADKANRSKKYKDNYRALVEKAPKSEAASSKESVEEKEGKEGKESDYMTKEEMKALLKEHALEMEESMLERRLQSEKKQKAEVFASKYDVKDEAYDKLVKTADAILSVNDDMEFDTALERAYSVLHPEKPKPSAVVRPGGKAGTERSEVQKIMEEKGLTKEIAEELVAQGKTAKTLDSGDWVPLMPSSILK